MRTVIVGGVAGGAAVAARLRRVDEAMDIVMVERGQHVSFANCGLPYYVGDVIKTESALALVTPVFFKETFNIDVRVNSEVIGVDPIAKTVSIKDTTKDYTLSYDELVLSPGAKPFVPPVEGANLNNIYTLRSLTDAIQMRKIVDETKPKTAVVVGAGFVGLEMAENLAHRGVKTTIIEMMPQILAQMDADMAIYLENAFTQKGVDVVLGTSVSAIKTPGTNAVTNVFTKDGRVVPADIIMMSAGVRPETSMAKCAGVTLGPRNGIQVDDYMRTNVANIWAVGDAVETTHPITGQKYLALLAGPAGREGRLCADNIVHSIKGEPLEKYRGSQGTFVCGAFGAVVAATGASEKLLKSCNIPYDRAVIHGNDHATYYPGATEMHLKVLYSTKPESLGRILGAQGAGFGGVDKRLDVIAALIQKNGTMEDLQELQLCYAPPFGSARDPLNIAGMVAINAMKDGLLRADWCDMPDIDKNRDAFIVDTRGAAQYAEFHIPGAINIPLQKIRESLNLLPKDKMIYVYCFRGKFSYFATRMLTNMGYKVTNVQGGSISLNAAKQTDPRVSQWIADRKAAMESTSH